MATITAAAPVIAAGVPTVPSSDASSVLKRDLEVPESVVEPEPKPESEPTSTSNGIDKSAGAAVTFSECSIDLADGSSLVVRNEELALKSKTCPWFQTRPSGHLITIVDLPAKKTNPPKSIPLYNVLWAEVAENILTVDYAHNVSKTKLRPAKFTGKIAEECAAEVQEWIQTLLSRSYGRAKQQKRAKVFVNPHAGPGGAEKRWTKDARPLFEAARMKLDVVRTTYSGEAVELSEKIDVDAFDTIVSCSGDGLPHEVFNGLGKRPDAKIALKKIAISHIPCGSGNAMSCNLYGTHRASLAALAIIKGIETPMDLVSVTQGDRRTLSFLSQSLGIVAESDLGTENLRWMGGARFTYGLVARIFQKKLYPCDIAVKTEIEHKDGVKEHYKRSRSNPSLNDLAKSQEGDSNGQSVTRQESDTTDTISGEDGLPPLKYGTIQDDLPSDWELIPHQKLGNFYCGNVSVLRLGVFFSRKANSQT
jgi:sphingosine kinase